MNTLRMTTMTLTLALTSSAPALAAAVDTSKTYSSGLLIGLFVAFCSVVVVVQMVPSLLMLVSFVKGVLRGSDSEADATGR